MNKLLVSVLLLISSQFANADTHEQALEMIAKFSERICKMPPSTSEKEEIKLSGAAKAELRGLVSKIADLGVEGAAEYNKKESAGVLQEDLAELWTNGNDCSLKIADKLIDKLIVSSAPLKKSYPVELKGISAVNGTISGVTMSIPIDDEHDFDFNNISGPLSLDVGDLEEGVHIFEFTNISAYFMNPMAGAQQHIGGLSCDGEFTVAKKKTYQIIVWIDGSGLTCDLR